MKQLLFALLSSHFLVPSTALACTSVLLTSGNAFVTATNADFYPLSKKTIFVNARGVWKSASPLGSTGLQARWLSKFGSVTSTFLAREYPLGGMNEAGLIVHQQEGYSTYLPADVVTPKIHGRQTVQYLLDTSGSIDEAVANLNKVRPRKTATSIHWWVCEASGNCAVLEYQDTKAKVYRDKDLPVPALTNTPYDKSLELLSSCYNGGCEKNLPAVSNDSDGRFIKAGYLVSQFKGGDPLQGAFDILEVVRQSPGPLTLWQVAYRQSATGKKEMFFVPEKDAKSQWLDLSEIDFSCKQPAKYQVISADAGQGNLLKNFRPYDRSIQETMLNEMLKARILPAPDVAEMIDYPDTLTNCEP